MLMHTRYSYLINARILIIPHTCDAIVMPVAYILNMLIHTRHSCLIWHSCLDHTSHKWRHASAHRIHFNYAHTFKTWLSLYDTRFLSIPHTCDVIRMAFHITVQVLTHVTSPFYHSYMASGSYEYSRSTLYHVWFSLCYISHTILLPQAYVTHTLASKLWNYI